MNRLIFLLIIWIGTSVALFAADFLPSTAEQKRVAELFRKQGLEDGLKWDTHEVKGRYTICLGDKIVGTLFFRQLIPKMERFTYFVLLDNHATVRSFGILSYTSRYGASIGRTGWGDKWIGKKVDDLVIGKEIDAISGATLSLNALSADLFKLKRLLKKEKGSTS